MTEVTLTSYPKKSKHLAEFVGIMLGDGHIGKAQIQITLSSLVDKPYAIYVIKLFDKIFGYSPKMIYKKDCNAVCIYKNGIDLVESLVEIGLKIGNKVKQQVRVPSWILENKEYSKFCCRGLIDTDGCIAIHRYYVNDKRYHYKKLVFTNHSIPLVYFVYNTLSQYGLHPKMYSRLEKRRVWLYNSKEVIKYLDRIGSSNERLLRFRNGE